MAAFQGFRPETFSFLAGLTHHNDKAWFDAHREDYQRHVVEPALALIADLDPVVRALSPHYRGIAKKQGGSLMRVYRDVRFGHDKTPYKTNVGIQLRHDAGRDVHAPGFYVHLALDECFVGTGSWHPAPPELLAFRQSLSDRPQAYFDALEAARFGGLEPVGDRAARVPRGFAADHPAAEELRRKDFLVSGPLDPGLYLEAGLVDVLGRKFEAAAPYMAWLCRALGVAF